MIANLIEAVTLPRTLHYCTTLFSCLPIVHSLLHRQAATGCGLSCTSVIRTQLACCQCLKYLRHMTFCGWAYTRPQQQLQQQPASQHHTWPQPHQYKTSVMLLSAHSSHFECKWSAHTSAELCTAHLIDWLSTTKSKAFPDRHTHCSSRAVAGCSMPTAAGSSLAAASLMASEAYGQRTQRSTRVGTRGTTTTAHARDALQASCCLRRHAASAVLCACCKICPLARAATIQQTPTCMQYSYYHVQHARCMPPTSAAAATATAAAWYITAA